MERVAHAKHGNSLIERCIGKIRQRLLISRRCKPAVAVPHDRRAACCHSARFRPPVCHPVFEAFAVAWDAKHAVRFGAVPLSSHHRVAYRSRIGFVRASVAQRRSHERGKRLGLDVGTCDLRLVMHRSQPVPCDFVHFGKRGRSLSLGGVAHPLAKLLQDLRPAKTLHRDNERVPERIAVARVERLKLGKLVRRTRIKTSVGLLRFGMLRQRAKTTCQVRVCPQQGELLVSTSSINDPVKRVFGIRCGIDPAIERALRHPRRVFVNCGVPLDI